MAYGLATPPSKLAGTGGDSGGSSSSAGGGGGGSGSSAGSGGSSGAAAGVGVWAKASDRGGDKAGGKSPPVPIVGSAARPLDSMAELFVNHQMQARRPSTEGVGGGAQDIGGSGGDGGAAASSAPAPAPAPSSTVGDPSARVNKGSAGDGGGVLPGGAEAPFAASAATVDGRAGKDGGGAGIPLSDGVLGRQQLGLEYDGKSKSGGGGGDGDGEGEGADRLDGSYDPDDPTYRRTQSLTAASAAGLPPTGRNLGSPATSSPGARSDSEDVQPRRGYRAGRSGRGLAGWRRNFSVGAKKRAGT